MHRISAATELTRGCAETAWPGLPRNAEGVTLRVTVTKNGNPADLSGMAISCHVLRGDGTGIQAVSGEGLYGRAEVALPAAAFAVPGECRLTVRARDDAAGVRATLAVVYCTVTE